MQLTPFAYIMTPVFAVNPSITLYAFCGMAETK